MWNPIKTVPKDEAVLVAGGDVKYPIVASWSGIYDEAWQIDAQAGEVMTEVDIFPEFWMSLDALPPVPPDPFKAG